MRRVRDAIAEELDGTSLQDAMESGRKLTAGITDVDYPGLPRPTYVGGGNSLADRGDVDFNLQRII